MDLCKLQSHHLCHTVLYTAYVRSCQFTKLWATNYVISNCLRAGFIPSSFPAHLLPALQSNLLLPLNRVSIEALEPLVDGIRRLNSDGFFQIHRSATRTRRLLANDLPGLISFLPLFLTFCEPTLTSGKIFNTVPKSHTLRRQSFMYSVQWRANKEKDTARTIMLKALPDFRMQCLVYIVWQCVHLWRSWRIVDVSGIATTTCGCGILHSSMWSLLIVM